MTDIIENLTDERLTKLRERTAAYGVSPEELVCASVEQLIGGSDGEFEKAANYLLNKNAELYRRLA